VILILLAAGMFPGLAVTVARPAAQPNDALVLDHEGAVKVAVERHRDAEAALLDLREAELDLRELRTRLIPRLLLDLDAPQIVDSRTAVWTGDADSLVWRDWNMRRESGSLSLDAELPLGTSLDFSVENYHRDSETGSMAEEFGWIYGASVTQNLLGRRTLLGELRDGGEVLELRILQAAERLAEFRHRVIQEFYTLLRRQLSSALAGEDLANSNNDRERAESRFRAGLIAESDFLKIELENLQLRAAHVADSVSLSLAESDFGRLLGLDHGETFELAQQVPSPVVDTDYARRMDEALKSNIRALGQRQEERAAQRELRRKRLELLPDLDLALSWQLHTSSTELEWNPGTGILNRSISLGLSIPIYNRGAGWRAVQRARIALRRQELERERVFEDLDRQLKQQLARIRELDDLIPLQERQRELAERDLLISRERHEAGWITSQALIDAGRQLSSVRLALLDSRIEHVLAAARLQRLTGADREQVRELLR